MKNKKVFFVPETSFKIVSGPLTECQPTPQEYAGAWDWKAYFAPLSIVMTGIAASFWTPDVCHSKRQREGQT